MPTTAGYKVALKISGAPTAFTTQAMTNVTGNTWRITNSTMRVWSPTATITTSTGTHQTVNRLGGFITFTAPVTTPTVTGQYLPMTTVALARTFSFTLTAQNGDVTPFIGNTPTTAYIQRIQIMQDTSATLEDLDIADGFITEWGADTQMVIQVYQLSTNADPSLAGWFLVESVEQSGSFDDIQVKRVNLVGLTDLNRRAIWFGTVP